MLFIVARFFFFLAGPVPSALSDILAILAISTMDMNCRRRSRTWARARASSSRFKAATHLRCALNSFSFPYLRSSSQFIVILAVSVFVFWQTSCTAICEMRLTAHSGLIQPDWPGSNDQRPASSVLCRFLWPWPRPSLLAAPKLFAMAPLPSWRALAPIMNIYEDLKNIFFASVVL